MAGKFSMCKRKVSSFVFLVTTKVNNTKCSLMFTSGKKATLYPMNGMRVFTVECHASDTIQPDGCKLSALLTFNINSTQIWRLVKHLWIMQL